MCLDLVKQREICLNEVKCTKMHSDFNEMSVYVYHAFTKKAVVEKPISSTAEKKEKERDEKSG